MGLKASLRQIARRLYRGIAIFSKMEVVENRLFNILGLQIFRILIARSILKLRRFALYRKKDWASDELINEGIVVLDDFLSDEKLKIFTETTKNIFENEKMKVVSPIGPEDLTMNSYFLDKKCIEKYPIFREFTDSDQIKNIFKNVLTTNYPIDTWELQNLIFNEQKSKIVDTQNVLHIDTFFTNLKIFYYLHDVEEFEAPFMYVKGTHKFSKKMLLFHYVKSILSRREGSWSVDRSHYEKMELRPTLGTFKKNTLVIADVCGLHGRGDSRPGVNRRTFKCVQRKNPYNFFQF